MKQKYELKQKDELKQNEERIRNPLRANYVFLELTKLIDDNKERLAAMPHPYGFTDRETGKMATL